MYETNKTLYIRFKTPYIKNKIQVYYILEPIIYIYIYIIIQIIIKIFNKYLKNLINIKIFNKSKIKC